MDHFSTPSSKKLNTTSVNCKRYRKSDKFNYESTTKKTNSKVKSEDIHPLNNNKSKSENSKEDFLLKNKNSLKTETNFEFKRRTLNMLEGLNKKKIFDTKIIKSQLNREKIENMKKLLELKKHDEDILNMVKFKKILEAPKSRNHSNFNRENKIFKTSLNFEPIKLENIKSKVYDDKSKNRKKLIEEIRLPKKETKNTCIINKDKEKLMTIYKLNNEKIEQFKKLKKNKSVSLEKYQENILNLAKETLSKEKFKKLESDLKDIQDLNFQENLLFSENLEEELKFNEYKKNIQILFDVKNNKKLRIVRMGKNLSSGFFSISNNKI